jgi:hypothetical protein
MIRIACRKRKDESPMTKPTRKANRMDARALLRLEAKLTALPRDQQALVATFAQGLRAGFSLRASADAPRDDHMPDGDGPPP